MSIIVDVVIEERDRLNNLLNKYMNDIDYLPRGALSYKKIKGHDYCYLAYRNKGKWTSEYIGKKESEDAKEIAALIAAKKVIQNNIRKVKYNLKEVESLLRGRKI